MSPCRGRESCGEHSALQAWCDFAGVVRRGQRDVGGDAVGAGAIADVLPGAFSPEAELAAAGFSAACSRGLHGVLAASASGRELAADGFAADITLAAAYNASEMAPRLQCGVLTA